MDTKRISGFNNGGLPITRINIINTIKSLFKEKIVKDSGIKIDTDTETFIDKWIDRITPFIPDDASDIIDILLFELPNSNVESLFGFPPTKIPDMFKNSPNSLIENNIDTNIPDIAPERPVPISKEPNLDPNLGNSSSDELPEKIPVENDKKTVIRRNNVINPTDVLSQAGKETFVSGSAQLVNEKAVVSKIRAYRTIHIIASILISTVGALVEILTGGQIDKIIESLSVLYNLTPVSTAYNASQGIELESSLLRPYRYLAESKNTTQIPTPTDLIQFLVKEQLAENTDEALKVFKRYMSYHGFNEFWSNAFWGAHWVLPNTSELFAMYHRNIISKETLRKQIIINDVKPEWVDKIIELSERLPSRTEARLINRTRKMSTEKINAILRNEGIKSEFLDDYKFFIDNQELDTLNLQYIREIRDMYVKGYILDSDYRNMLKDSIYSDVEIEKALQVDTLRKTNDVRARDIKSLITEFKKLPDLSLERRNEFIEAMQPLVADFNVLDSIYDSMLASMKVDIDIGKVLENE